MGGLWIPSQSDAAVSTFDKPATGVTFEEFFEGVRKATPSTSTTPELLSTTAHLDDNGCNANTSPSPEFCIRLARPSPAQSAGIANEENTSTSDTDSDAESSYSATVAEFESPCKLRQVRRGRAAAISRSDRRPKKPTKPRKSLTHDPTIRHSLESKKFDSLARNVENAPKHYWTASERELLCTLNRWYTQSPEEFARIFNGITGLELPARKVKGYYENYIVLHGEEAFPELKRVRGVPFEDQEGVYQELRKAIEITAFSLGIEFQRREHEGHIISGKAATARSPRTRRLYKQLVRRAHSSNQASHATDHSKSLGGQAIGNNPGEENFTNVKDLHLDPPGSNGPSTYVTEEANAPGYDGNMSEDYNSPGTQGNMNISEEAHSPVSGLKDAAAGPSLVFRVWSDTSRTSFTNEHGFVAHIFSIRQGPVTPPLCRTEPFWDVLANAHLSKKGGGSSFVSVCRSFIQVLNYASEMDSPHLALIDYRHPSISQPNQKFHAHPVIKDLKSKGEMEWARYWGNAEYLIWGQIPKEAILNTLPVSDLKPFKDFLSLGLFDGTQKTPAIAKRLQQKRKILDANTGYLLAQLGWVLFGSLTNVTLEHITDFIQSVIDGWSLIPETDIRPAAIEFSEAYPFNQFDRADVIDAFIEGMKRGVVPYSRARCG